MYKKKIIVTGANGFLGKNVVNLLEKKYQIKKLSFKKFTKIKKDKKKEYLDNFIKTHKPFAVIHLATYFSKKKDKKTLIKCLNVNYFLSKMLYQVTIDNSVNKFIKKSLKIRKQLKIILTIEISSRSLNIFENNTSAQIM